jgi:hypothetical protein
VDASPWRFESSHPHSVMSGGRGAADVEIRHIGLAEHFAVALRNHALGPNESARVDVAVMDNFIYGEPQPAGP